MLSETVVAAAWIAVGAGALTAVLNLARHDDFIHHMAQILGGVDFIVEPFKRPYKGSRMIALSPGQIGVDSEDIFVFRLCAPLIQV